MKRYYDPLTQHHLIPVSRGGRKKPTLLLRKKKHEAWHTLFGTLTLSEIIALLERVRQIKGL
jgi:hypothetical protein